MDGPPETIEHEASAVADQTAGAQPQAQPATPPPRPVVPDALKARTKQLLDAVAETPDYVELCRQREEDLRLLFPDRLAAREKRDAMAGLEGTTAEKDADAMEAREVRVSWVFRQSQQTVAATIGRQHQVRCRPKRRVRPPRRPGQANAPTAAVDERLLAFAETLELELGAQGKDVAPQVVRWVRESTWFRMAVLRLTYAPEAGPVPVQADQDLRENAERLRQLAEGFAYGDFDAADPEAEEMRVLRGTLGLRAELPVAHRFRAEIFPLNRFRIDPMVRRTDQILGARWQSYLLLKTRAEVARLFPFTAHPDGSWEGVHPDDLKKATVGEADANGLVRRVTTEQLEKRRQSAASKREASPGDAEDAEELVLHEVEHRQDGVVYVLLEGVDYPIATYRPTRPPSRWFTGHILVKNEAPDEVAGPSDTELQGPIATRINHRLSDADKARWLSLDRYFYPSAEVDPRNVPSLQLAAPGKLQGIPGTAKSINELLQRFNGTWNPLMEDVEGPMEQLRYMARMPEQSMGMAGTGTTATAVLAAQQGAQVAFAEQKAAVRQAVLEVYTHIAEVMLQVRTPKEVRRAWGPWAFWPHFADAQEVAREQAAIDQQVEQQVAVVLEQQQLAAMQMGHPWVPDHAATDAMIETLTTEAWMRRCGLPDPMTRRELYESLDLSLDVSLDPATDNAARVSAITQIADVILRASGGPVPSMVRPLVRKLGALLGEDDVEEWLPPENGGQLVQALSGVDPGSLPPEALAQLARFGQVAAQRLQPAPGQPGTQAPEGPQGPQPGPEAGPQPPRA